MCYKFPILTLQFLIHPALRYSHSIAVSHSCSCLTPLYIYIRLSTVTSWRQPVTLALTMSLHTSTASVYSSNQTFFIERMPCLLHFGVFVCRFPVKREQAVQYKSLMTNWHQPTGSLLIAHCLLLIAYCSLLIAHCFLPFRHVWLRVGLENDFRVVIHTSGI